ncbi:MAG: hypothetical protein ACFFAH_03750 [Promethearchaeota archaeon]
MKRKITKIIILLIKLVILGGFGTSLFIFTFTAPKINSSEESISRSKYNSYPKIKSSSLPYTNITVISDGYQDVWWNNMTSEKPDIVVDDSNNLHVVWQDETQGKWGGGSSDTEIMYVKYTAVKGQWSNITVISDGYNGQYWNNGISKTPDIAVDEFDNLHVVWEDETQGRWSNSPSDTEIMYVNYTTATGQWSNITVISDGYQDIWWNNMTSVEPNIVVDDSNNLHVVWEDETQGRWSNNPFDTEIMYVNCTTATGQWSNITVISDGYNGQYWNNGISQTPDIAVDEFDNLYVVWEDKTQGRWSNSPSDTEIMYVNCTTATGQWSNITVISDGYNDQYWNAGFSMKPKIAVDDFYNLHVVWCEYSKGIWGGTSSDTEIMYVNYTVAASQWSNITVISDGYQGVWWNDMTSEEPDIDVDDFNNLHVVWRDTTFGKWGGGVGDAEIMYVKYTTITGQWSNITVISDGYQGEYWNTFSSYGPKIALDGSNIIHVVWEDYTPGKWQDNSGDTEIMYCSGIKDQKQFPSNDGNDGDSDSDSQIDNNWFIIVLIILAIIAAISTGAIYSVKKKNKIQAEPTGMKLKKVELTKKKKISKSPSSSTTIKMRAKAEKKELKKTESEVDVKIMKFLCVVHKGTIKGDIYLCPKCNNFYCRRCAKALKEKGENCWVCESKIKFD